MSGSVHSKPVDTIQSNLIVLSNPSIWYRYRYVGVVAALLAMGVFAEKRRRDKEEEGARRVLHRRNSGVQNRDGSKEIFVPYKDGQSRVVIRPIREHVFDAHRRLFLDEQGASNAPIEGRVGVNRKFIKQLFALASIMMPRFTSKETGLLGLQVIFLMLRTWLSLLVARLDGIIVRDLVAANGRSFMKGVILWLLLGIPASYTNSMIKFLQSKLSIAFRTRLTRYVHDLYLNSRIPYYKTPNLDGGIDGADQYITSDITHFCDISASMFSTIGKPAIDMIVFNYQLTRSIGVAAVVFLFVNYIGTASVLRKVSPAFGRLAAIEARLEGEFRSAHSRIITNAEEIAFYNGAAREHIFLTKIFNKLTKHVNGIFRIRIAYNMFEDFLIKYGWSALGLIGCSIPVFFPSWSGVLDLKPAEKSEAPSGRDETRDRANEHTSAFITNKRLLLSLADAGGRMMYSYKDLAELAGYTSRVYALISTLHRVRANAYPVPKGELPEEYSISDVHGTVQEGFDGIRLEDVPVVAPAIRGRGGEQLLNKLNIVVKGGDHMLISGPNGVGKTAIMRHIAGLWPVYRGLVSKPKRDQIFYVPQRPYLSIGSLRDQIIYPYSHAQMVQDGRTDDELFKILDIVKLEYIPAREGGWETVKEWKDVFSGGEKQRVSLARMFFHRPKFAMLDEATSAVSADVEGMMYQSAKERGITLITISHRPTLIKYHQYQLKIGGGEDGHDWELAQIGTEKERLSVEKEIKAIEEKLSQVDSWRSRRQEIDRLLKMPQEIESLKPKAIGNASVKA